MYDVAFGDAVCTRYYRTQSSGLCVPRNSNHSAALCMYLEDWQEETLAVKKEGLLQDIEGPQARRMSPTRLLRWCWTFPARHRLCCGLLLLG